jgi:hypothetical protein
VGVELRHDLDAHVRSIAVAFGCARDQEVVQRGQAGREGHVDHAAADGGDGAA